MNSNSLQQNFILFFKKAEDTTEAPRNFNGRLCCEKCRFSTKDTALYERHIAQHEEVTFSCTICNHISYSRVESQRHLVKHKGSFPYKCNWCPYGAVRRDYMVKHIQRIHGKSADGIFMNDCTKKIEGTQGLCLPTPKTLGGPSNDVKVMSHSAGNVAGLLYSASQARPSAPYHVTSTTCTLPVIKSQPYIVPSTTHTVCKITQGIVSPPNVTVKEAGPNVGKAIEYTKKMIEQTSLEKTAVTGALPRVHVGMSGDRAVQQKPPLQSQVASTTEKTVIQSKIIPKIQVGYPVINNNHLKTLLSNQREVPAAQKSAISGAVQNIPVAHVVQRPVSSSANPTIPVERFRQGAPSIKLGSQNPGKNTQHKSRPNILLRTPPMAPDSNTKSGVEVGLSAPLNQPIQHKRPLMISGLKERNPPRSSVQVELLAPLNQPIQHNKPLTVSCPEEITIPAGCLVELVEVKNVNGTRELELRLVPQQLTGPQQGDLKSTTVNATTSRLSFKCKVATDDNQLLNLNHEISTPKANAEPEQLIQGSLVKKFSTDDKVNVKNEAEVNGKVRCSRKNGVQALGYSSKGVHTVSRSVVSNPSESRKFTQQLCVGHKNVTSEPVKPLPHMHSTVKNISLCTSNKNIMAEGLKCELRAAQPSSNKQEDADLSHQGLPVISSVFSLCSIPQDTLSNIHTREGDAKISEVSESKESIEVIDNLGVCRPTLKTEDETRSLTNNVQKYGQLSEKDEILEEPKASEDVLKEKLDAMGEKTFANDENKITPEICRSSTDVLQTDPSPNMNSSPVSKSNHFTQPEKMEKAKLESEKSLLAQSGSPLASAMNPIVTLIRMPSMEFLSLSEPANKAQEKLEGEESITARPVACCTSNQQNLHERTIKLVLKRKWSETKTAQDQRTDLVCIDMSPTNKKAKKQKKRSKKHKSSKDQQLFGNGTMGKMCLMPLKDDQLVKLPGPNQPVVILNYPVPLVKLVSIDDETLNNQQSRNSVSDLCNPDGTTLPKPVQTCPAFKMTLKKVQGQEYQVTELLLKGIFENTVL